MNLISQLPQLVVPPLHQSLRRYLLSIAPLVTREEFDATRKVTLDFARPGGVGEHLQKTVEHNMLNDDKWVNKRLWHIPFLEDRRPYLFSSAGAVCPSQSFRGHVDR
ncbi:carnitine O-acetyltransferase-like [Amphiura filiformis]|uniref:carnitine O-acetyltransferase-like n=1 Tax=Amphiura filiformis TaxID=82378 RepID=UPI003B217AEC